MSLLGGFLGGGSDIDTSGYYYGEGAPTEAAGLQEEAINRAIGGVEQIAPDVRRLGANARLQTRRDTGYADRMARGLTRNYRRAGSTAATRLREMLGPGAQRDYVMNNPFYQAMRDDAADTLFANEAARGKVGSGGTARALDNAFALLGENLVQNRMNNLRGVAGLGQWGAGTMMDTINRNNVLRNQFDTNRFGIDANALQRQGYTLADLYTDIGDVQASGVLGEANARIARDQAALQAEIANSQSGGLGGILGPIMKIAGGAFGGPAGAAAGGAIGGAVGGGAPGPWLLSSPLAASPGFT